MASHHIRIGDCGPCKDITSWDAIKPGTPSKYRRMQTNAVVCAIVRVCECTCECTWYTVSACTRYTRLPCPMSHVPCTRYQVHWYTLVHPRTHDVPGTRYTRACTRYTHDAHNVPGTPTRALPCTRYAHAPMYQVRPRRYAHAPARTRRIPHVACQPPRASPHVPIYHIAPVLSCAKVFTVVSFSSKPSRAGRPGT